MFSTKPLLLVTPHHTGTWFWFKFLTSHYQVGGFVCDEFVRWHHIHLDERRPERRIRNYSDPIEVINTSSEYTLYHSHPPRVPSTHFCMLMSMVPTFVSLRDPLLSVISHIKRRSRSVDKIFNPVNDWTILVEDLKGVQGIKAVPIDLLYTEQDKRAALVSVLSHLGLPLDTQIIDATLEDWIPVNSFGPHILEEYYAEGSVNKLRRELGTFWTDLRKSENLVRPFLEPLGYKDLLWWS